MSFDALESSLEAGRPIFFYRFTLGTTIWRFTSAEIDMADDDGHVYTAAPITHDRVSQTGDANADALTIECSWSLGPAKVYFNTPPAARVQVAILRRHVDDTETKAMYVGEISQVNFGTPGHAKITCETFSASMQREGLRLGWQRGCPYALYDTLTCKVNQPDFVIPGLVLSVNGFAVTVNPAFGIPDNHLAGGFATWLDPVRGLEYRAIESNVGAVLQMFGMTEDIYAGLNLSLYPGCDLTYATCRDKFNNRLNYGGCKDLPARSPFDGKPVF